MRPWSSFRPCCAIGRTVGADLSAQAGRFFCTTISQNSRTLADTRNILPRRDEHKIAQLPCVVLVNTSNLPSKTWPHSWICKAYARFGMTLIFWIFLWKPNIFQWRFLAINSISANPFDPDIHKVFCLPILPGFVKIVPAECEDTSSNLAKFWPLCYGKIMHVMLSVCLCCIDCLWRYLIFQVPQMDFASAIPEFIFVLR